MARVYIVRWSQTEGAPRGEWLTDAGMVVQPALWMHIPD
jgi:hypothetical protein